MLGFLLKMWTFPNTAIGLSLVLFNWLLGGRIQRVDGVVEGFGGIITKLLRMAPTGGGAGAAAMTLGRCIIGINRETLDIVRDHEHVHVRQYEKWGPFFIPVYFLSSAIAWYKGQHPYLDNIFEVEAYRETTIDDETSTDKN
ncbi:MAG: hypothetical protein AAGA30_09040 [Planctomycetota bacterium]